MVITNITTVNPYSEETEVGTATIDSDGYFQFNSPFTDSAIFSIWLKCDSLARITFNDVSYTANTTWQKFTWKFDATQGQRYSIKFEPNTYYIYEAMLEKGTKPTDWCPSQNDIDEQFDLLDTRYVELEVTTDGITARVGEINSELGNVESSITELSNSIELKVSKDSVINSINLSTEEIKISGEKVNIDGQVTFNSFNSNLQNGWNNMQDQVGEANDTLDEITLDDRTTINGGKIATNTIDCSCLKADTTISEHIIANDLDIVGGSVDITDSDNITIELETSGELSVLPNGTLAPVSTTKAVISKPNTNISGGDLSSSYVDSDGNKHSVAKYEIGRFLDKNDSVIAWVGEGQFGTKELLVNEKAYIIGECRAKSLRTDSINFTGQKIGAYYNDTSAADIKELLRNKIALIPNENGTYLINGGWQGNTWGYSIGTYVDGVKQLTFHSTDAIYYCRLENGNYTYSKTEMSTF